jgi:hypothetical protein
MMTLLLKEIRCLLSNSRFGWLLLMSYLIPLAVFFMLFRFSGQLIQQQIDGSNKKKFKVAWISKDGAANDIRKKLERNSQIILIDSLDENALEEAVSIDSISIGIVIADNFDSAIAKKEKAEISLYFKGEGKALSLVQKSITAYRRELTKRNIKDIKLPNGIVNPIEINEKDLSSIQEIIDNVSDMLNRSVAILLSLLIFIFGVSGARFALSRLFWSEQASGLNFYYKQAAISSFVIFGLKVICASLFSFLMMFLSLLGFATAIYFDQGGIIQAIIIQLKTMLGWNNLALIMLLALPLGFAYCGFWAMMNFMFNKKVSVFFSNLSFMILLVLLVALGSSAADLNHSNAFLPLLSPVIFIKTMMSSALSTSGYILVFLGTLCWGSLFNLLNFYKFKKNN